MLKAKYKQRRRGEEEEEKKVREEAEQKTVELEQRVEKFGV